MDWSTKYFAMTLMVWRTNPRKENLQRIARYLLLDSDSSAQAISNRMTAYLYQPKRLVSCGTVRIYSEAVRDWRSLRFLKANYGVEQISDLPHIARENSWEEVESYEAFFTNNLFPYYQEVAKLLGPDKRRAFWGRYLNTLQTLTDGMNDDWHVHFIHLPFIHAADKARFKAYGIHPQYHRLDHLSDGAGTRPG